MGGVTRRGTCRCRPWSAVLPCCGGAECRRGGTETLPDRAKRAKQRAGGAGSTGGRGGAAQQEGSAGRGAYGALRAVKLGVGAQELIGLDIGEGLRVKVGVVRVRVEELRVGLGEGLAVQRRVARVPLHDHTGRSEERRNSGLDSTRALKRWGLSGEGR